MNLRVRKLVHFFFNTSNIRRRLVKLSVLTNTKTINFFSHQTGSEEFQKPAQFSFFLSNYFTTGNKSLQIVPSIIKQALRLMDAPCIHHD